MFRRNGTTTNLESAIAILLQNQAQLVAHVDEDRRRFSRIESDLEQIKALVVQHNEILKQHVETLKQHNETLKDHDRILKELPEAIRQKIGFKPQ
jgi:hypothetical protein